MPALKLQQLQWACGLAVAACCGVLAVVTLRASLEDYRGYEEGVLQLTRLHDVMAAANAVSAERRPSNFAMTSADADAAAAAETLAAARADTDRKLDKAEGLLVDGASRVGLRGAMMDEVRIKLAAGRQAVDAVRSQPRAGRPGGAIAGAIETMFTVADECAAVRDALGRAIIARSPQVSAEVFLGMSASSLREYSGRLGSYVIMLLTSEGENDEKLNAKLIEMGGRLRELRQLLTGYAGAYFPDGPIEAALKDVEERYFLAALPAALVAAENHGRVNALRPTEFSKIYGLALKPSETLREEIAKASTQKLEILRDRAWTRLATAGSLIALIFAILLGVTLVFRRTLFAPLLKVRDQVVAIAEGDLAEPQSLDRVSREIVETIDGLAVLRAQQRRKLELERDQKVMAQQLLRLSQTDALTGLLNRRAIEAAAGREIAYADDNRATIALVMFDIDHFKAINDTHGHAVGDTVLKRVAEEIGLKLRPGDLFARFGGEEFVALLPNVSESEALAIAERLCETLGRTTVGGTKGLKVTASFGVSIRRPKSGLGWESMVATADRRLYAAKAAGRNRVVSRGGSVAA